MIVYNKLWETMEKKGITKYKMMKYHDVSPGQLSRLKKNMYVSTHTINYLCRILECKPGDIMEYIPDDELGDIKRQ